jgi:hypothetical protein
MSYVKATACPNETPTSVSSQCDLQAATLAGNACLMYN